MKIVFSKNQFESAVNFLSEKRNENKEYLSEVLSALIKELVRTSDLFIQTMGFCIVRELNVEDGIDYIYISVDPSFDQKNISYIEKDISENVNLN